MLKSLFAVRNWRIGVKIFAGFGSIIVLLALMSAFAVHELSSTGASVTRLNTSSEAVQRILEIDRNMEVMRQRALRFKQLHDKGFRIFRPAHYPTTKPELDAADKYGMLVLEEINVTGMSGEQLQSAEMLNFARSQLSRLIERDRSHPSIFAWSVGNENRTDQPGSETYVRDVIGYGKSLDKTRPFTEVSR